MNIVSVIALPFLVWTIAIAFCVWVIIGGVYYVVTTPRESQYSGKEHILCGPFWLLCIFGEMIKDLNRVRRVKRHLKR